MKNGNEFRVVYDSQGILIRAKSVSRNIPTPGYIMKSLATSKYKDWVVVANKEVVKHYYQNNVPMVKQSFSLKISKDNLMKILAFNYEIEKES